MFDINDKTLVILKKVNDVFAVIMGLVLVILSVAMTAVTGSVIYLAIMAGVFFVWLGWLTIKAFLSLACDIKFIRNKLYDIPNSSLEEFLGTSETLQNSEEEEVSEQNNSDEQ